MLSHYNMASNIRDSLIEVGVEDVALSFLPLCHVAERLADYVYFNSGATVAYAESIDTVAVNMGEVRPTFAVGVPRFFEKVYGPGDGGDGGRASRRDARSSSGLSASVPPRRLTVWMASRLPLTLKLKHRLADKLVFHKLRGRLGGRIKMFVSGAAPLPRHLAEFFYAPGLADLRGLRSHGDLAAGLDQHAGGPQVRVGRQGHPRTWRFGLPTTARSSCGVRTSCRATTRWSSKQPK